MSFLNNIFGNNKPQQMPDSFWNYLETPEQLKDINETSFTKPVAIFKHSTRCSISRMAWNQFLKNYNIADEKMELYHLDLIAYRDISNAIASDYKVQHQSPQIIVIKDGVAVFHTSHESIDALVLEKFI